VFAYRKLHPMFERRRSHPMFERFTHRARQAMVLAQEEARQFNHNYIEAPSTYFLVSYAWMRD
jgi:hypothetical protein